MADDDFSTQQVLEQCGITYRKLDIWTSNKYLGDDPKHVGNGVRRRYTEHEVKVLKRIVALTEAGVRVDVASKVARGEVAAYNKLAEALENCT